MEEIWFLTMTIAYNSFKDNGAIGSTLLCCAWIIKMTIKNVLTFSSKLIALVTMSWKYTVMINLHGVKKPF